MEKRERGGHSPDEKAPLGARRLCAPSLASLHTPLTPTAAAASKPRGSLTIILDAQVAHAYLFPFCFVIH